jgi:hypothetical protein
VLSIMCSKSKFHGEQVRIELHWFSMTSIFRKKKGTINAQQDIKMAHILIKKSKK